MGSCGHQVDADWLLCSSAGAPVTGPSTATDILQSVFAEDTEETKCESRIKDLEVIQGRGMRLSFRRLQEGRPCARLSGPSFHDFSDFDEEEHLDGCPVKWLYRRQAIQPTHANTVRELKVRKMNLKTRQNRRKRKNSNRMKQSPIAEAFGNGGVQFTGDDEDSCIDHGTCFSNYMPPRPLTGLRPWFCVFLAPRSAAHHHHYASKQRQPDVQQLDKRGSVSVRSLSLPQVAPLRPLSTPRTSRASRWAGPPPVVQQRSLQAAPAFDIALKGGKLPLEEDRLYRLKRFLDYDETSRKVDANKPTTQTIPGTRRVIRKRSKEDKYEEEIHVVCSRVQFFERPGKPMR